MTSSDYRKAQEYLKNEDIYSFAERLCEKHGIIPERDYPQTTESRIMQTAARRHLFMNKAFDLIRRMIFLGATENEILCAAEYLLVLGKSIDLKLNYSECEKILKIPELESKYSRTVFLQLEAPFEELKDVIERDKGYYGIAIKEELA